MKQPSDWQLGNEWVLFSFSFGNIEGNLFFTLVRYSMCISVYVGKLTISSVVKSRTIVGGKRDQNNGQRGANEHKDD